ncbi:MAG: ATP-binding protein [Anaerolineales bacterium]|nr:ATP-binding protein [Anaerolineales bacterium]
MTDNVQAPIAENQPQETLFNMLRAPEETQQLDIPMGIIIDLIVRILFNEGDVSLRRISEVVRLSPAILDPIMAKLQHDKIVEVASAGQMGRFTYIYALTDEGAKRARDAMERSQYVGPAPVPIEKYNQIILLQTNRRLTVSTEQVQQSLSHLILPDNFHRSIGPAVNSGTSLFLYGPPGNGKTTVAEAIAKLIAGTDSIWVPYAVSVAGYIIKIHDPLLFKAIDLTADEDRYLDKRWGKWERPAIMVGGELIMEALELRYDTIAKFYEAPLQMKANGGMFLIDDFGRQTMPPQQLLNRWIVPLESRYDFLRLRTGQSFQVPFRQLIVFSTNLDPNELVDGAFLRRIQMKVAVKSPDDRMFFQIFGIMAKHYNIPMEKEGFLHLVQKWYRDAERKMEAVHPRDILKIIVSICSYTGEQPRLTPQLVDEACSNYFVETDTKDW